MIIKLKNRKSLPCDTLTTHLIHIKVHKFSIATLFPSSVPATNKKKTKENSHLRCLVPICFFEQHNSFRNNPLGPLYSAVAQCTQTSGMWSTSSRYFKVQAVAQFSSAQRPLERVTRSGIEVLVATLLHTTLCIRRSKGSISSLFS